MGCTTSTNQPVAIDLSQYRVDSSIKNFTKVCPECYKTGVYYYGEERAHREFCNACDVNLCNFHFRQKQLKNAI